MDHNKKKNSSTSDRTKKHLKEAFIELINEKGYSHVTITDIVQHARYNRATFYLHFLDKLHITQELKEEMFNKIKQTSMERYTKGKRVRTDSMDVDSFELVSFVYDHRLYFNLLLKEDTIPGLYQDLPRAIFEMLEERFTFTTSDGQDVNSSRFKLYMAHGTAGLILEWIKGGYQESPKEITLQLIEILKSFTKEFIVS